MRLWYASGNWMKGVPLNRGYDKYKNRRVGHPMVAQHAGFWLRFAVPIENSPEKRFGEPVLSAFPEIGKREWVNPFPICFVSPGKNPMPSLDPADRDGLWRGRPSTGKGQRYRIPGS